MSRVVHLHSLQRSRLYIIAYKYALADFGRAINICPDRAENHYFRAQCHAKLGNFEQAIYDYEVAETRHFVDAVNLQLSKGMVAKLMHDYEYAIEAFTAALVTLEVHYILFSF